MIYYFLQDFETVLILQYMIVKPLKYEGYLSNAIELRNFQIYLSLKF